MGPKKKKKPQPGSYMATGIDAAAHAKLIGVDPIEEYEAFEFVRQMLQKPLPDPWAEHSDKKGRVFYWNKSSRSSSWQHPMAPTHKALVAAFRRVSQAADKEKEVNDELEAFNRQGEEELARWRKSFAPDDTPYYYKVGTQLTRWDDPRDELMGHMQLRVEMLYGLLENLKEEEDEHPEEDDFEAVATPLDSERDREEENKALQQELMDDPAQLKSDALQALEAQVDAEIQAEDLSRPTSQESRQKLTLKKGSHFRGSPSVSSSSRVAETQYATPYESQDALVSMGFEKDNVVLALSRTGGDFEQALELLTAEDGPYSPGSSSSKSWKGRKAKPTLAALGGSQLPATGSNSSMNKASAAEIEEAQRRSLPAQSIGIVDSSHPGLSESSVSPQREEWSPDSGGARVGRLDFQATELPFMSGDAADMNKAIIPDEMAVLLGIRFDVAADRTAFQILKPLFVAALPLPWQVFRKHHGRYDFYHPGLKEYRRRHPLFGFFGELLAFLRENANTALPMAELLEAQVFKEASPQTVRERLGIWEGPLEDSKGLGGVVFCRQWQGTDEVCVTASERRDDPRLEAAANISFRLGGWMHLWRGFLDQEPFPMMEGRLGALAQQVGECVVTAPGMATTQMIAHMQHLLPKLEPPPEEPVEEEEVPIVLTAEEEAVQPLVTGALSKAYGIAIFAVAEREAENALKAGTLRGDTDQYAAKLMCVHAYRQAPPRVAKLEHEDWLASQVPEEEEEEFEPEYEEEHEEVEETSEEEFEEQEEVEIEAPESPAEEEEEEEEEEPPPEPEPVVEEEAEEERELPVVNGFLEALEKESAELWAERELRPMTPPTGRRKEEVVASTESPVPKLQLHRQRLSSTETMWKTTEFGKPGEMGPGPPAAFATSSSLPHPPDEAHPAGEEMEQDEHADEQQEREEAEAKLAEATGGHQIFDHLENVAKDEDVQVEEPSLMQTSGSQMLPGDREAQVDAFARTLLASTSMFDQFTGDDAVTSEYDDFAGTIEEVGWRRIVPEQEPTEKYSTGRGDLSRVDMPTDQINEPTGDEDAYESVARGCAARPNSPSRGKIPPPHYMANAKEPPTGSAAGAPAWAPTKSQRPRSANGRVERENGKPPPGMVKKRANKGGPVGKPAQAKLDPRPRSAEPRLRKSTGLVPYKHTAAAEMAAASTKRFLSRTCGTMQAALLTFDPSGDGRFSREEWAEGLEKLDYQISHDIQEIFTVLDKRQHHMLTLSDLLDYANGIPVGTGMPPLGIRGVVSSIFEEVLDELKISVCKEAMVDMIAEELQAPRGDISSLPDVEGWLKKRGKMVKPEDRTMSNITGTPTKSTSTKSRSPKVDSMPGDGEGEESGESESEVSQTDGEEDGAVGQESRKNSSRKGTPKAGSRPHSQGSSRPGTSSSRKKSGSRTGTPDAAGKRKSIKKTAVTKADREEAKVIRKVEDTLRRELAEDPTRKQTANKLLKDRKEIEPEPPAVKKEVKRIIELDVSINAAIGEALRKQLGRAPTVEEVAAKRFKEEAGREPQPSELEREIEKAKDAHARSGSAGKKAKKKTVPGSEDLDNAGSTKTSKKSSGWARRATAAEVDREKGLLGRTVDPLQKIKKAREKASGQAAEDEWQSGNQASSEDRKRKPKSSSRPAQISAAKRYAGYGFVDEKDHELPEDKLLPFVARPASEICKTYSHIFRLLSDPRVKKLGAANSKRSVHVSVPRAPSNGGYPAAPGKGYDMAMPPSSGKWGAKSSPQLSQNGEHSSGNLDSGGAGTVTLPPLSASSTGKSRPWVPDVGSATSGIDAEARRSPESLRAQGSLTGTL